VSNTGHFCVPQQFERHLLRESVHPELACDGVQGMCPHDHIDGTISAEQKELG